MKTSGIGGQAVLEGVMMRHKNDIAVAVRKPDGDIVIGKQSARTPKEVCRIFGWPIIRGVAAFISSLVIGIQTLMFSANFFIEEEDDGKNIAEKAKAAEVDDSMKSPEEKMKASNEGLSSGLMFATVAFSLVLAIVIFMLVPYWGATGILKLFGSDSVVWVAVIEGILKLIIFIAYVSLISLMKDIKRTFMYHGSEHKCINCIESGHELNVDNVMASSKEHRRCGTSFLFFVIFISIIFFIALDVVLSTCTSFDTKLFVNKLLRMCMRLVLIPVVAGLSYEFIQWAGNSDSKAAGVLSKPGLWIQGLTTKEPERDMVEVAIASVEAVFDWRAYLREQGYTVSEPQAKESPESVESEAEKA